MAKGVDVKPFESTQKKGNSFHNNLVKKHGFVSPKPFESCLFIKIYQNQKFTLLKNDQVICA